MFCSKCGNPVGQNNTYCNKCGNYLGNNNINQLNNINNLSPNFNRNYSNQQNNINNVNNKKMILVGVGIGVSLLVIIFTIFSLTNSRGEYYFSNNSYDDSTDVGQSSSSGTTSQKKSKYSTVIVTDNTYSGVEIADSNDAIELIEKDSINQKNNCPSEIRSIEDEIISNYNITAVNLCELDIDFAKEISNVFKKIYDEYPSVRGELTNLTLTNASMSEGYIAAFMPIFQFASSDSSTGYPWVVKTQVLLNTTYFLNPERLKASVQDGSNSGHFPPNATMYSPVAHELGHYLSFLAMKKNHHLNSILLIDNNNINDLYEVAYDFSDGDFSLAMIEEAFENYKKDVGTTLSLDEWRATISNYAVAKDNSGNYIYDETIAEAFHDVYLNDTNAKDASKYIVAVLKEKLEA